MPIYYTEYPTGEFFADNDEEALLYEPDAKVIYKESDTADGFPMIVIRDTHVKEDYTY
jgi:hypothetical protein